MRVYYDRDADVNLIKAKNVAIIGYGSQGHAHANNLKDSGAKNLMIGLRHGSQGVAKAEAAGLKVADPADCAKWADVVMVLTPDEGQGDLYREKLGPNMKSGAALALIFAVFLTNPAPICVLDEVDAPLDDYNVERFCNLLDEMTRSTDTRFVIITHNPITMARMNRLYGVTMAERGVSQLVSVDLEGAVKLREVG